jgi:RimJ/RimL family protein N-acetyltransferase
MWLVPSKDIGSHAISLVRGARAVTDTALQDYGVRRLQICVKVENDTAFKFAKALRFEVESVMRKFGPEGADYYMMTRF